MPRVSRNPMEVSHTTNIALLLRNQDRAITDLAPHQQRKSRCLTRRGSALAPLIGQEPKVVRVPAPARPALRRNPEYDAPSRNRSQGSQGYGRPQRHAGQETAGETCRRIRISEQISITTPPRVGNASISISISISNSLQLPPSLFSLLSALPSPPTSAALHSVLRFIRPQPRHLARLQFPATATPFPLLRAPWRAPPLSHCPRFSSARHGYRPRVPRHLRL